MTGDAELLGLLGRAQTEFGRRVALVAPDDVGRPTPSPDWTVRQLLNHVLGVSVRYTMLLRGAGEADLAPTRTQDFLGDDVVVSYEAIADDLGAAFTEPGVLERPVAYRVFPAVGRDLLGLGILECTLHAWDLARAIGVDDRLDPALLHVIDDDLISLVDRLRAVGVFADPLPVPAGAGLQDRVLLRSGRRP